MDQLLFQPVCKLFGLIGMCEKTRLLPGAGSSARIPSDVLTGQSLELMLWQPTRGRLDLKTEQLLAGSFHSAQTLKSCVTAGRCQHHLSSYLHTFCSSLPTAFKFYVDYATDL